MRRFAALLDRLLFSPSRLTKLALVKAYLDETPDPDRGWALAALTGELDFPACKPAQIRALAESRVDPELFAWSYDFVGDLAETVALIWPEAAPAEAPPGLAAVVDRLTHTAKAAMPALVAGWLDGLDATGRWALLKLVTSGLRVGLSARLARTALAEWAQVPVEEIEEIWHGLAPPYDGLFRWLKGEGPRPAIGDRPVYLPPMLATPLDEADLATLDPADFLAEWKWDGIRVQIACRGGERRLFSRGGDEIGASFPDVAASLPDDVTLDGELLVGTDGEPAPFNDLQQRLGRKRPAPALIARHPAFVRLYDALRLGADDLRTLPLVERRARLEAWYGAEARPRLDLSPLIAFADWPSLAEIRAGARAGGIEGVMLKRRDSPYLAGRPKGPWFKWKRGALTLDCVMLYAQRGHGKRSSLYSDFTFGAWRDGTLVPVGKAYSGYTDAELKELDRWVREHTVKRFGPVREVEQSLVVELAFDSVHRSTRHKSGLAMRFPRVARLRWDKPAAEADTVETLAAMIG